MLAGYGDGSRDMELGYVQKRMLHMQKVPADYQDQLHDFRKSIITIHRAKHIQPFAIVNMDQTMCRFNMQPSCTNRKKGVKTV